MGSGATVTSHNDSTKIYDHGASWIFRINKLKNRYLKPENVLFTLSGPEDGKNRKDACKEIERYLIKTGVQVTTYNKKNKIVDFVLN